MPANSPATIQFAIPASTAPDLDVPVSGFDPTTQTWKITLATALPAITHQVTIDGYTQGLIGIPFRYPSQQASQTITIAGNPTGGTFTLTTSAPARRNDHRSPSMPPTPRSRPHSHRSWDRGNLGVFRPCLGQHLSASRSPTSTSTGQYAGVVRR